MGPHGRDPLRLEEGRRADLPRGRRGRPRPGESAPRGPARETLIHLGTESSGGMIRAMDSSEVSQWFGEYLGAFASCGRGEAETSSLLAYYGVPLLLTVDNGFFALTSGDQIVAAVQPQIDKMRAAGYARSEILSSAVTALNATSALYRG